LLGSSPLEVEQQDGGECVLVGNDSSSQTRSLSFFVHWLIEFWITIKAACNNKLSIYPIPGSKPTEQVSFEE
jgi:hypothetical protein